MSGQGEFFGYGDRGEVRPLVQETRREAQESIKGISGEQRRTIFACIKAAGSRGVTDLELEAATGLKGSTVRPRRGELLEGGFIRASGETRLTESNRQSVVWVAV